LDLSGWANLTRLEPARNLRLTDLGHLRVGARANIALYDLQEETRGEEMLSALRNCWCLIKDGVLVREAGEFTGHKPPTEIRCREIDEDLPELAQTDLFQNATLRFENLGAFQLERCPAESL
jgi:formylmethanofuran dehydrogenase subunit A